MLVLPNPKVGKVSWKGGAGSFFFLNRMHAINQETLPLATQPLFDSTHPLSTHICRQHKAPLRTNTSVFFPVGWNCHTLVCGTVYSRFQLDPDLLGKLRSFTKPTPTGLWVDECLPDWKIWSGSRKCCGIVQQSQRQIKQVKTGICGATFFLSFVEPPGCQIPQKKNPHTSVQDGESHSQRRPILLSCRLKKHLCRYSICCCSLELDGSR